MDSNKAPGSGGTALESAPARNSPFVTAGALSLPAPAANAAPPGPAGIDDAPSLASLLQALRRRWLLAVTVATVGAALTIGAVLVVMPPKFQAEVRLHVASRSDTGLLGAHAGETEFVIYKNNLPSLLKAPLNLSSALNQKIAPTKLARDLSIVRERGTGAIDWLDKSIKTDYNLGPEILRVTLGADRGDEVADLLNAIVRTFLEDLEQQEKAKAQARVETLRKNQEELEQELSRNRRQLVEREKAHNLPNAAEVANRLAIATGRLQTVETQLIKTRLDQTEVKQQHASCIARQQNVEIVPASDDELRDWMAKDPRFQPLFQELFKAEKDLSEAERVSPNGSGPYRERRERLKRNLDSRMEEFRPELEKAWRTKLGQELKAAELVHAERLRVLDKQIGELDQLLRQAREEVTRLQPGIQNVPAEILSLRDKIGSMERANGKVAEEIIVLRANASKTRVTLLQQANPPQEKDVSRQLKFGGAGAFGMFGLLLIGVAFVEFRSRKVNSADEVTRTLGITVVGAIPPMPDKARKPISDGASPADLYWQNRLVESIDAIRTMLLHTARHDDLRVIMIGSAVGGEGKTSLASQLAASLARAWKRTLLIDGDLRNPAIDKVLNLPLDPGFSEVLRGEVQPGEAIRATAVSRLWAMSAGHWDAHAVQALAQDQVRDMMATLKEQYDFIIVDSSPVLPVADSLLLAERVDGVLFSVMRNVSRLPAVWAAQQRLQSLGIRTLGAVIIGDQGKSYGAGSYYQYAQTPVGK